ncbi:MAG: transporter [Verrucomicrobiales bacterium]|nr:transporter [Verrucomicrobiales bacterium]
MIIHKHNWYSVIMLGLLALGVARHLQAAEPDGFLASFLPAEEVEESGEIETDRDSFTPATTLIAPSKIMIEAAWSFIDNRNAKETHSLPELLIRYGATDWLELRVGANYEVGGESAEVSSSKGGFDEGNVHQDGGIEKEANVSYGLKLDITDQRHWIPDSALIIQAATPIRGEATATTLAGYYTFGWVLQNGWLWDTSIRYATRGGDGGSSEQWAPSTVIKIPLTEKTKAHLEYFGMFDNSPDAVTEKHYISPGVHYLITENLEIGIRVGWGLNDQAAKFFSNIGFGWQF